MVSELLPWTMVGEWFGVEVERLTSLLRMGSSGANKAVSSGLGITRKRPAWIPSPAATVSAMSREGALRASALWMQARSIFSVQAVS